MKYYSTNHKSSKASFEKALMRGLAEDEGLYMPAAVPRVYKVRKVHQVYKVSKVNFQNTAFEIAKEFTGIPEKDLKQIIKDAFDFPIPLVRLDENLYVLELFHGPTLSFKDFGARFMARVMEYYMGIKNHESGIRGKLNIIVATSGDTGSAAASAFYGLENINVFVLYPSKRVSPLQEKQIATLGKNVFALEVKGDFDDCQRLAKQALADKNLRKKMTLSSANSINIGRLIPQSFYYAFVSQYFGGSTSVGGRTSQHGPTFIVPSGNFGNLTGAIIAKKMGFPIGELVAAVNKNFGREKTARTLSSAMDVAKPSNWARVEELGATDIETIAVSEAETKKAIRDTYKKYGYVADPHTAVGLAAAEKYELRIKNQESVVIVSTAHPAKFPEIVAHELRASGNPKAPTRIPVPPQLQKIMKKEKKSVILPAKYEDLKKFLLSRP